MNGNTPYGQPKAPKTITRIKSDRFLDLTNLHTWILFAAIGIIMYLFRSIALATDIVDRLMYGSLMLLVAFWWVKYFRSDELVEFQKDRTIFFIAEIRGKHVINAYSVQLKTLMKIIHIKTIHQGGVIEFQTKTDGFVSRLKRLPSWFKRLIQIEEKRNNEFGILMETFPPRISDELREIHEAKLEKVVNGLPVNTLYESIACSVQEPKKPVLQYLLDLQKSSGGKASDQHLADLYLKISQDDDPIISWRYFTFLSLGEHKNFEASRIQYGAVIPGLLRSMSAASLYPVVLTDERDIINAYQIMLGEVSI